jgi:type II secretory pathway component PulF
LQIVRTVYRPRVRADVLHTLSTGLAAGLGVPETLALAEKAAADPSGARACRRIAERVAAGDTLAEAIRSAGIVPAGELVSLAGGERSGTLPDALARLAADQGRSYRTRLAWSIRIATTLCFLAVGAWIGARIVGTLTGSVLGAEGDALNEIQREIPGLFRPLNPR